MPMPFRNGYRPCRTWQFFLLARVEVFTHIGRKLPKAFGVWIHCPLKAANTALVVIAGIDQHYLRVIQQCIPVPRLYVGPYLRVGVYALLPHRNDFLLEFDLHAIERHVIIEGFLVFQVREAGVATQVVQYLVNALPAAGDSTVDSLPGQQQRAQGTGRQASLQQGLAQVVKILQTDELV